MDQKTLRDLIVVFKENTTESVSDLLNKIEVVNTCNREKYLITNAFCTDIFDNVDLMSIFEVAKCFDAPVDLPDKLYKYTRLKIAFCWGSIIIVCRDTAN